MSVNSSPGGLPTSAECLTSRMAQLYRAASALKSRYAPSATCMSPSCSIQTRAVQWPAQYRQTGAHGSILAAQEPVGLRGAVSQGILLADLTPWAKLLPKHPA